MGPLEGNVQTLHVTNKEPHLNVLEKFNTYREIKKENHINDKHAAGPNVIFDVITRYIPPTSP
jgi:hypothetical protein